MAGTVSSDHADGPVLTMINKRIRALRKKLNRITQMEESIAQGKVLVKEQEEVFRSKPYVVAAIEELEKLRQPLSAAVAEEITAALEKPVSSAAPTDCNSSEKDAAEKEGESFKVVEDLLNLLYFGSMFDVKSQNDYTATMLTRTHERGCCLTYDTVTDDDAADLLGERDLDLISSLQGLLISRPADSSQSHKSALQNCIEHAKLWLSQSDQHIGQAPDVTYAQLREKLTKIMASNYFTAMPEMRFPVDMAAATGGYASFQEPVQGSVLITDTVPISDFTDQNEQTEGLVETVSYDNQPSHVEQFIQEQGTENFSEFPSQEDESRAEFEPQEQQYAPRRSNRGGIRGGRRGYSNGRGGRGGGAGSSRGGSYQNGRNNFYDQQGGGSYYPRSNYRGRGGRGGGYGGGNNYAAAPQGGSTESSY